MSQFGDSAHCSYVSSLSTLSALSRVRLSLATLSSCSDSSVSWRPTSFMNGDGFCQMIFVCQVTPYDLSYSVPLFLKTFFTFLHLFECVKTRVNVHKACIQRTAVFWNGLGHQDWQQVPLLAKPSQRL